MRALGVFLALPLAVVLISASRTHWNPTGDLAHTELMLRAIPRHPPLVGVAARVGTAQDPGTAPGPSMAYLLAPLYFLGGRTSLALLVSYNALHFAAMIGAVVIAFRTAGARAATLMAFLLAMMTRALMPNFFLEPWNVWIPVFAFLVMLLLVWRVLEGHRWALPWAAAVGMHAAQTHISYVPLVGSTLVAVTLASLWQARQATPNGLRVARAPVATAIGVSAVALIPPIYEQLTQHRGNLARLLHHFGSPSEPVIGLRQGLKGFAGEFNLFGPWILGPGHIPAQRPNLVGFLLMIMLVCGGFVVAWRRRDMLVLHLYAVVGWTIAVGIFAVSRIFGGYFDYVIRWIWPLNALSVFAALLALSRAPIAARLPTVRCVGAIVAIALLGTAALSVTAAQAALGAQPVYIADSRLVQGLADQLDDKITPTDHYLLRWHDPTALGAGAYGLVLEMERRGDSLGVDETAWPGAQRFRVLRENQAAGVLWFVTGQVSIDRFAQRSDARLLAEFDPRNAAQRAESDELRRKIEQRLTDTGRSDLIVWLDVQYGIAHLIFAENLPAGIGDDISRYNYLRAPGAVFLVPPFAPPYDPGV